MFKVMIDKLFPFVKTYSSFCHSFPILGGKVPLEIIENFSNHAKQKIQHVISGLLLKFVSYFHKPHN